MEQDDGSLSRPTEPAQNIGTLNSVSGFVKNLVSFKKLMLSGLLLLVVVAVLLGTRPGDPLESKEYKELQTKKGELESKRSSLNAEIQLLPDVTAELSDYEDRVERWNSVFEVIGK